MASVNLEGINPPVSGLGRNNESSVSAVSWAAVLAGTLVAVSLTLVLMAIGSGLGFASISPWSHRGLSATGFTVLTAAWLVVVQWGSSAVGGYTTGRLRTKWAGVHTHEVFFRDTAHGLLTWATATVFVALISAASAVHTAERGAQAAATVSSAAMGHAAHGSMGGPMGGPMGGEGPGSYEIDTLLRSSSAQPLPPERYGEVARIMKNALGSGDGTLSEEDRNYLTALVASHSSIPPAEAQKRVDDALAQMKAAEVRARQAADAARKAAAEASIYIALSMLIGAFIASVSAALGGRLRDEHHQ